MNQALKIKKAVEKARREFINQTEKHIKTVLNNYELAMNDITKTLSSIDTTIDSFSTQRLMELQNQITQRITQIKGMRDGQVIDALNDAGKSGFDTQMLQREIMGKASLGIDWNLFLPRGVEQYQSFALQLCDQYDRELVNAIQQRLRLGFMERKSWSEMITDIRQNAFGFKKYQRIDRKDKGASWKIKRMVRTETSRMRTMAEEEVISQDHDIIGVYFHFGGGPCDGSCVRLVGEYYKDGSGMGWPPPSIPIHPNSYSKDTEIYTERGFIPVNEVKVGEKVLSLNPETFNLEWLPVIETFQHKADKMVYFCSNYVDLLVTLDHNVFCKHDGKWGFVKAINTPQEAIFLGEHNNNYNNVNKTIVDYNDMTYCVQLPKYHTVWVRRNGKTTWSGNCMCYLTDIYPEIKYYVRNLAKQEPEKEVAPYIKEVNDLITKGVNNPNDAIKLGGVLRNEVNSRMNSELFKQLDDLAIREQELEKIRIDVLNEFEKAHDRWVKTRALKDSQALDLLDEKRIAINKELNDVRIKLKLTEIEIQTERSYAIKQVVKEIRDTGKGIRLDFVKGSDVKAQKVIQDIFDFLPKEWAEASAQSPLEAKVLKNRAFYMRPQGGKPAKIVLTTGQEMDAAVHEIGHRIVDTNRVVGKLETEFFNERTKGHSPIQLPGYSKGEQYIPDDWSDPYVGKYYAHGAHEVLSTGLEGLFAEKPTVNIWKDLKHVDFVLGLLGGI